MSPKCMNRAITPVAHCATGFQLCRPSAGMQISSRVTCARRIKTDYFSLSNYWETTVPLTAYMRLSTQHGYGRGSRRGYPPFHCLLGSSHLSPSISVPRRKTADQLDVAQPTILWRFHSTNQGQHNSLRLQLNQGVTRACASRPLRT